MTEQTIYDEILGELVWNNEDECWSSQVEINPGHLVNVTIDPEDAETGGVILIARRYFATLQQEEIKIRHLIADEMLNTYNNSWNDGENIGSQNFIEQIKLEDIVFYASGVMQLFYHDGDLFGGHGIVVTTDEEGNYQSTSLIG
jgi:hypothetical protein